jgi:DNA polymerase III delta subunit
MIVRQVRLLLLFKEAQADRIPPADIPKEIGAHPYAVSKLAPQAANFELSGLEALFFRLEELDHQIKTGGIEVDIALNTFVAEVTASARSPR